MVKFNTAIKWMRAGKKVKRPSWKEGSYLILGVDESILYKGFTNARIHLNQMEATDWEIYSEKPEDELKTLKDFDTGMPEQFVNMKRLKQEAIKRVKHYLKELEMDNSNLDINKKTGVKMMTLGKNKIEILMCGAIIELVNFCDITDTDLIRAELNLIAVKYGLDLTEEDLK